MVTIMDNYQLLHELLNESRTCADSERGGGGSPDPLANHQNIGFLSNTGPDPLKNHKATMPAFNVGPSSANSGILILPTLIKKKTLSKLDPLRQNFLDPHLSYVQAKSTLMQVILYV